MKLGLRFSDVTCFLQAQIRINKGTRHQILAKPEVCKEGIDAHSQKKSGVETSCSADQSRNSNIGAYGGSDQLNSHGGIEDTLDEMFEMI